MEEKHEIRRGIDVTRLRSEITEIVFIYVRKGTSYIYYNRNDASTKMEVLNDDRLHSIFLLIDPIGSKKELTETIEDLYPKCDWMETFANTDETWKRVMEHFDDDEGLTEPDIDGSRYFHSKKVRLFIEDDDKFRINASVEEAKEYRIYTKETSLNIVASLMKELGQNAILSENHNDKFYIVRGTESQMKIIARDYLWVRHYVPYYGVSYVGSLD